MFIIFAIPFGAAVMRDQLLVRLMLPHFLAPPVRDPEIDHHEGHINSPNALKELRNEEALNLGLKHLTDA